MDVGPPCRSVSVLRQRSEQDGGPPVLRSRTGEGRFGLPGLTACQQELADHDATLWLKNLWWMKKAKEKNSEVQLMAEQPRDPIEWKQGEAETMPSFLVWPETRSMMKWLGLEESRFDQGALEHVAVKPTTVIHNMSELQQIDGLKSERKPYEEWPMDVKEGIQRSKKMAEWAPGLVEVLVRAARRVLEEKEGMKMKALSMKERQEVAGWEAHFMANHVPYRRDCMICLESMGKDRQRRRIPHADAYTLAVDIAGPYQKGTDQESGAPRYLLVATVTIPLKDGEPLPHGLQQMSHKVKPREGEDEMWAQEEVSGEEEPEQWQEIEEGEEVQALSPMELKEVELANEKWKEFLGDVKAHETQTLTWGVPLQSRASREVVRGLSKVFTRFQMLQIPMYRLHSDRAKEFLSAEVKRWATMHQLLQTYTAGDEPEGNARTEREIGVIKARTRLLLRTSKSPVTFWPLAARQALEERCRQQLWKLGVPSPQVLPFGATAVAKRKSWFNRGEPWKWPMEKVRVFGPAADMSISSRGHFVQLEDGKFVRSTVIVIPTQTAETLEEVKQQRKKLEDGAQDRVATDAQGNAEDATLDISGNPAEAQHEFLEVDLNEVLMETEQHQSQETGEKKKRVRLHKKSPPATFYPELQERPTSLCSLQGRGEWHSGYLQQDHLQEMEVWQHGELKKQLQECWSNWLEGVGTSEQGKERLQDMEQIKGEIETLERVLETKREEEQVR